MDDVENMRLELSALKVLLRSSDDRSIDCVCSSRIYSKHKGLVGWENSNRKNCSIPNRMKGKKNGTESQKFTVMKPRNPKVRPTKKRESSGKGYFCNYKSRKQHIENYRKEFSTVKLVSPKEDCNPAKNQTLEKIVDPYIPDKADPRYLYKRLSLLKTLSDFYNIGVSPRDFRRQAYLPPVAMGDTRARMKSITKIDAREMEANVSDLSAFLDECQIADSPASNSTEVNRVRSAIIDNELDTSTNEDMKALSHVTRSASSYNAFSGLHVAVDSSLPDGHHKNQVSDIKKPSQKIIDGLSNSLKEQINVLRSGLDLKRSNYPFHINNDRFMHARQTHMKSDIRVKEKTVSSIPKAQKGKTLYISILGRNPLNKSLHNS